MYEIDTGTNKPFFSRQVLVAVHFHYEFIFKHNPDWQILMNRLRTHILNCHRVRDFLAEIKFAGPAYDKLSLTSLLFGFR